MDSTIREKMNLAILAPGELYGGVERFVCTLAKYLREETEITPLVVLFQEGEQYRELISSDVDTVVIRSRWKYDFSVVRRLIRLFKARRITVVHTNGYKATILGGLAGKICGARVVKTEHGRPEPSRCRDFDWFRMRCNLAADEIVTRSLVDHVVYVTRDLHSTFQKNGRDVMSSVIYNGIFPISEDGCSIPSEIDPTKFNIGIVGRLTEVKGHHLLLDALMRLRDISDVRLNIVGEGPLKTELEGYCQERGLMDRVRLLDFKANVFDYIRAFDLLAMPSLYEGLPYALLESMFLKAPIVASNVGGPGEIIEHEVDGLLVRPGNAENLAEAIRYMRIHGAERTRLAENAYRKVCDNFMVSHMARKYAGVFQGDLRDTSIQFQTMFSRQEVSDDKHGF